MVVSKVEEVVAAVACRHLAEVEEILFAYREMATVVHRAWVEVTRKLVLVTVGVAVREEEPVKVMEMEVERAWEEVGI